MRCLYISILSFAILLRILVGINPHSGQDDYQGPTAKPKSNNEKYGGDYEAQRHWMEITYHLPKGEWYWADLEYWGLDYPPLTAYVSLFYGWVAHTVGSFHDGAYHNNDDAEMNDVCHWDDSVCIDKMKSTNSKSERQYSRGLGVLKDLVALHSSRWGFEDPRGKLYMRFTVLISDLLIYISAVWVLVKRLTKVYVEEKEDANSSTTVDEIKDIIPTSQRQRIWLLLTALSQPALILIDHGHFQYNTVSLGLALWSFHFMAIESSFIGPIFGSVLFSLALNFKQMELYHAPAVFAYLLGRCFRCDYGKKERELSLSGTVVFERFFALANTVVATFTVLWVPFILYPRSSEVAKLDGVTQIIKRLFPFQRGIFEGKVANIWCALSIKPFSIRNRIPQKLLPLAALGLTFCLILPPCWILFKAGRGDNLSKQQQRKQQQHQQPEKSKEAENGDIKLLLWGTASTSLAFFLASFQVHEKGIIIPLASISLLMLDAPDFVQFFSILATWSLWPLLVIDRLTDAYVCCLVIFLCLSSMTKVPLSKLPCYDEEVDIFSRRYITRYIPTLSWIAMILLHVTELVAAPPSHLPDLYPVLWSFVGCGLFCISYLATVWAMIAQSKQKTTVSKLGRKKNTLRGSIPTVTMLGMFVLSCAKSEAFSMHNNVRTAQTHVCYASGKDGLDGIITQDFLERVRLPLQWEVLIEKEAKPVLNLSALNSDTLSLAEGADEFTKSVEDEATIDDQNKEIEGWADGDVWQVTETKLIEMGILGSKLTSQKMLTTAPQLFRLPTSHIVESASFLRTYLNGTNFTGLFNDDGGFLLTYAADDLRYGLVEYLPNMMFRGNSTQAAEMIKAQLAISPSVAISLLQLGVEGGLEERVSGYSFSILYPFPSHISHL